MKEVSGKYASALIHTDNIEDYAIAQIKQLCDQTAFEGSMIRIMPDIHHNFVGKFRGKFPHKCGLYG